MQSRQPLGVQHRINSWPVCEDRAVALAPGRGQRACRALRRLARVGLQEAAEELIAANLVRMEAQILLAAVPCRHGSIRRYAVPDGLLRPVLVEEAT